MDYKNNTDPRIVNVAGDYTLDKNEGMKFLKSKKGFEEFLLDVSDDPAIIDPVNDFKIYSNNKQRGFSTIVGESIFLTSILRNGNRVTVELDIGDEIIFLNHRVNNFGFIYNEYMRTMFVLLTHDHPENDSNTIKHILMIPCDIEKDELIKWDYRTLMGNSMAIEVESKYMTIEVDVNNTVMLSDVNSNGFVGYHALNLVEKEVSYFEIKSTDHTHEDYIKLL